jgi:hypothetical protein
MALLLDVPENRNRRCYQTAQIGTIAQKGLTVEAAGSYRVQIAVVFGLDRIILLSQLQPLLILSLVTRPVYPGGPSPFQGSWR